MGGARAVQDGQISEKENPHVVSRFVGPTEALVGVTVYVSAGMVTVRMRMGVFNNMTAI